MRWIHLTMLIAAKCALFAAAPPQLLSLKVDKDVAPPGGMVQVKVLVTEPTPISTGGTRLALDESFLSSVEGISAFSSTGDIYATAVVKGGSISFQVFSASGTFGMTPDYPVLTVAARIAASAPLGAKLPLTIDPSSLSFASPYGAIYPTEVRQGQLTIATGVSVFDVRPGSGLVPAGGVVTITGMNFTPLTTVQLSEAIVSDVNFISSSRIDVTLAAPAKMHGMRIRVSNPDGSKATYFAYQRTRAVLASTVPLLARTVPVFSPNAWKSAVYVVPQLPSGRWYGLAFASRNSTPVEVVATAVLPNGTTAGTITLTLQPNTRTARTLTELFPALLPLGTTLHVSAKLPIDTMALIGDNATEKVFPVPPVQVRQ